MNEQQVRLAARMYELRDTARSLSGDKYPEAIKQWTEILRSAALWYKCDPMVAVPRVARKAEQAGKPLSDADIMWLTAASVEIAEGRA